MSGFRFELQKVLELREEEEQDRARALADAERRAEQARRRVTELREIRAEEAEKLMRAHGQPLHVGQLRNLTRVIEQLADRVDQAEAAYTAAAEVVEETRLALRDAMTRRRVMDNLKDRKQEAWRLALQAAERKRMDELALGRFQRQNAGGSR